MMFGRLFRSLKEDGWKSSHRDMRELGDRDLADLGLMRPGLRAFEHAPVEVPNDRI